MKIYTSYWAKASKAPDNALIVCVSNTAPTWYQGYYVRPTVNVYPDWSLINAYKNGIITYEQFCVEYRRNLLGTYEAEFIYHEIENQARLHGKDIVVFTCWEKDPNSCHRIELARIVSVDDYCGEL